MVGYTCMSNRIIYAHFGVQPNIRFVVMQVYAPHSARPEEESNAFYAQLTGAIASLKGALRTNLVVLGDFNAKVCSDQRWGGCVGPFALGRETTADGERMVHLCRQWDMAIESTFYRHKPNDLYTRYSNANTRSQLDHVLMVRTSPSTVTDCRAYRSSMGYLGTDHCLLVCDVRTHFPPMQTSAPRMAA
jgi:exonuclease III